MQIHCNISSAIVTDIIIYIDITSLMLFSEKNRHNCLAFLKMKIKVVIIITHYIRTMSEHDPSLANHLHIPPPQTPPPPHPFIPLSPPVISTSTMSLLFNSPLI